ncbi:MAG: redox-sensing transcriptional repressor Rex [Akkermansiaceae bacterium]|nr:redox-sensing transcriptional repressor Rex [Akkermansiaceae bacterium]MDP4645848.1 redox-sensing transcriptional repressor Rex [Akkermansiaceae bacterium]MDP4720438.1 redox-sensing transcriptional repressor Rex [Akkermansiaceae bacterium]MDP4779168.1 redox-sensing transcriptional repressor Rex [Akkermansiaceae bacterium]MDP4848219.1 redox-sensing transcriptional repressor Rex [Akkermansiaceae bacterium]
MDSEENKTQRPDIPKKAIYRISIYHRCLRKFRDTGQETVSSTLLAKAAGVTPSQLRKDLGYFGQFGTRGLGYPVAGLILTIRMALGREQLQPVILVGAGNLGSALLRYQGFQKEGFEVVAAFDTEPESARAKVLKIPVHGMDQLVSFVSEKEIKIAILCVPATSAQEVTNQLVAAGIQGILNFSATMLEVPEEVTVNHVDLAMELEHLGYFIK